MTLSVLLMFDCYTNHAFNADVIIVISGMRPKTDNCDLLFDDDRTDQLHLDQELHFLPMFQLLPRHVGFLVLIIKDYDLAK